MSGQGHLVGQGAGKTINNTYQYMVHWKIAQSKGKGCSTNRIVRVALVEKQMFKQRLGESWRGMPGREERSWDRRVETGVGFHGAGAEQN